jgi:hypothetical protein
MRSQDNQSPASATMLWGWGNDPSKKGILKMVKMYQHINIPPYIQWFSKYYEQKELYTNVPGLSNPPLDYPAVWGKATVTDKDGNTIEL